MTNEEIREIFLANGFTIKPGHTDLKPYVYAAARALLAKADERVSRLADWTHQPDHKGDHQ